MCRSAPLAVRSLQDLARIYIRRTLRCLTNNESTAKVTGPRMPQKRKRRRRRSHRNVQHHVNTYVFVGNQLIPQPIESEEDEKIDDEDIKEEDKEVEKDKPEPPRVNLLRDKVLSLPLPESLKAYLLYYREK